MSILKKLSGWIKKIGVKHAIIYLILFGVFLAVTVLNFTFSKSGLRSYASVKGEIESFSASEEFNDFISTCENALNFACERVEIMRRNDYTPSQVENELLDIMFSYSNSSNYDFNGVYGFYNNEFFDITGWRPSALFNPESRPWYKAAHKAGGAIAYVSFYGMRQKKNVLAACKMLSDQNTIIGINIKLDDIKSKMAEMHQDDSGNISMVITDAGFIVADSDPECINENVFDSEMLLESMDESELAYIENESVPLEYNGKDYNVFFRKLHSNWYAITAINASTSIMIQVVLTSLEVLSIIVLLLIMLMLIQHNVKKVNETTISNARLYSLADIYSTMYSIDLIKQTSEELKCDLPQVRKLVSIEYDDFYQGFVENTKLFTSEQDRKKVMQFADLRNIQERMKGTNTVSIEFLGITGTYIRGRFIAEERNEQGEVTKLIWVTEIIDKEKRAWLKLEEEHKKAEQNRIIAENEKKVAENANKAKSSFLSNMSHEIRTPINSIIGMNEMILRECTDEQILVYAQNAKVSSNTLLGIVNDILDFSKIEAGKLEIINVDYDISSVLSDLVNMIKNRIEDKGLKFIVDVDPKLPMILYGDEVRIKQIITNILTNAAKYTEKGSVTLSVKFERIEDKHIDLIVSVIDTGIGIKKEDMAKLFHAFERIEEKRNRTIEGTGLGMNITQSLLEMMGTKLDVSSVYGEGSTFSFHVSQGIVKDEPIGNFEESFRNAAVHAKKYTEKFLAPDAKVLVVDDTAMNLTVFVSLLKTTKMHIDTAESGQKCLELSKGTKYDIIFLDHRMPHKDGVETLHELRAMEGNPNLETPVICLTANALSGARQVYIDAGFDDYLTKPIDPDKLEETIVKYLPPDLLMKVTVEAKPENHESGTLIPDFVREIHEIDVDKAIKGAGSEQLYMDILKIYAETVFENADNIEKLWQDKNIREFSIKVHALKSTTRAIGGDDIGELAQKLETAGDNNDTDTIEHNIDDFLSAVRQLGGKLSELVEKNEVSDEDLPEMSPDELKKCYSELKGYLDSFDFDSAETVINKIKAHSVPDEEKERCNKLKKALDDFDFEAMMSILE